MKNILAISAALLISLLAVFQVVSAQINISQGGTGTTTIPANYVVIGKDALHTTAVSTSSLGIPSGAATTSFTATYPIKITNSSSAINFSLLNMATTTVTCSGSVSCTSFTVIGTSPITITSSGGAASTTLLSDNNTFSGNNLFSASTTFSTLVNIRNASSTLNTFGTAWFPNLAAYSLLSTDANSKVVATSSIGNSLLANSSITVNGTSISLGASGTISAASSSILTDNNTFSGNNLFSASTTFSTLVNIRNASTTLATFGTAWFPNITAYNLIATDANNKAVATSSIGNSLLANSTISGISLGGTLGALSATDATLTFSGSYTGATARTVGVNLGNANTWTALQAQANTGTTTFSGGIESGTKIAAPYFNATSSTATSTFNGGIKSPCFSVDGIACLGSGSGTVGSGTTGQFPFYQAGGTTLTATSTIFATSTSEIGIGTTTFPNFPSSSLTNPSSALTILESRNPSAAIVSTALRLLNTGKSGTNQSTYGLFTQALQNAGGGTGSAYGLYSQGTNSGAGNISYGGYFESTCTSCGTSGANYSLYVNQASATSYALYSTGGKNYFNNNVGIGTTTPWGLLSIKTADTTATNYAFVVSDSSDTVLAKLNDAGLFTLLSATSTNLTVATSFQMPNSSNPSPLSAGYLTMSTNSPYQLHVGNGAGGTAVFDPQFHLTISSPATSTWSGTSTAPSFVWPRAATIQNIYCTVQPTGATLNIQVQYANSSAYSTVNATMVPASTTPGQYTFASNNTPATAATSTISFGTPAGSPTTASCTLLGVWTGI